MTVPSDGDFVFTPTRPKGPVDDGAEPVTITVPSLAKIPRDFTMVEAAADGNNAAFVIAGLRNLKDTAVIASLRALSPADWERFMDEWREFSKISVGE